MAFHASAVNKGAVVAVICVALVLCWIGQPAQGSPSCATHRCIAECPSKCKEEAASNCGSAKSSDYARCKPNCINGCTARCRSTGATTCDNCDSTCDSYCKTTPASNSYDACMTTFLPFCKKNCEKACKGETVNY